MQIGIDRAQNALQREWGNFPFENWIGIYWGLQLQLAQLIKIYFLPHLESFIWERKFEKKRNFKKYPIQPPNGVLPICKLKWDFLRTSVTACIIHKNIFSAPFGIFYMRTEIWKKKFQKISYTTPQWGASHLQTPVSKWELPWWGLQSTLGCISLYCFLIDWNCFWIF